MEAGRVAIVPRVVVIFLGSACAVVGLGMVSLPAVAMSQGAGPSLLLWLAVGLVLISVGYVILTRLAVAATFREGEIELNFGIRQRLRVRSMQLRRSRNLALARGSTEAPGDLTKQKSAVYVLLTYIGPHGRRDFAILALPGLGPLGGRAREFRTPLDSYIGETLT